MKKIITICVLSFGLCAHAQMKDVTVTLQPTASYNWFDGNTAIDDGVMVGGRLGFGFGEAIELRAVYEISNDLKNTVNNLDLFSENFVNNFNSRSVDIERIGGEFKANIPTRGTFVPYLTLGAGVQKLEVDVAAINAPENILKSEQIYANLGLGTQIRLGNRLFLNLEAKNTIFNMNPANVLFQEGQDQSDIEDFLNENNHTRMYNWSVLAGLQLYLGGRNPEDFSELDRAYYNKFSGGSSKFKLVVEPAGAFINFDNDTNLRDSYFVGGKAGFDLNQYVGIRGFYYQSTKNEEISLDFDEMSIYGGEFIANLNVARGLVPYLTVGGGYLNVYENSYVGKDGLTSGNSGYFAKGGVGVNIPLGRSLEIFGDASMMYTSQRGTNDLQNTINPDELRNHTMYTAGLRLKLGAKANPDEIYSENINKSVDARTQIYQDRIDALEKELSDAYKNNDSKKAVEIIEEKKELEKAKNDVEQISTPSTKQQEKVSQNSTANKNIKESQSVKESSVMKESTKVKDSKVEMTPKELEQLIERVIQGVDQESTIETPEGRIDRLERLLLEVNTGTYRNNVTPERQEDASQRILNKLNELDRKIENNSIRLNSLGNTSPTQNQDKTIIVSPGQQQNGVSNLPPMNNLPSDNVVITDTNGNASLQSNSQNEAVATGWVLNEGMSIFTGLAVADEASMIIGVRGNYQFTNSPFKFMPDIYVAPGKDGGFGINANAVIPFDVNAGIIAQPYVGLGLGYNDVAGESTFSPNLIIGTSFNIGGGKLFADYTAHNFIDIHRISVGYKFNF